MRLLLVAAFLLCVAVSELDRASSHAHGDVPTRAGFQSSHALEKKREEIHARLLQLIGKFSSVMNLDVDSKLYQEIRNEFAAVLEEYNALEISCAGRVELVHAAILGSFRLRGNVVKDTLAKGDLKQVNRTSVTEYAYWGLDLLKAILSAPVYAVTGSECGTSDVLNTPLAGRTALRLAAELQMLEVAQTLMENGGSVCHCGGRRCGNNFEGVACDCVDVLLPAVWNGDEDMTALLVQSIRETHRTSSSVSHLREETWLCHVFNEACGNTNTAVSPFQAAYLHCVLLSVCAVYDYLTSIAGPHCPVKFDSNVVHLALQHGGALCPGFQLPTLPVTSTNLNVTPRHEASLSKTTRQLGWSPRWAWRASRRSQVSGWAVYSDFNVGRVGCDLPRVKVEDLEEDAFKVYEQLSVPVVIEGATVDWKLWKAWKKDSLRSHWSSLDLLLGTIPYAEVFGETSGYATVKETLGYMESYARQEALRHLSGGSTEGLEAIQLPFYVFDSEVLTESFPGYYTLPPHFTNWTDANHIYQFILGPAGSGAPFHFHCPAVNALVYGRKKWFLYPPGKAVYSKQHPLKWYAQYYASLSTNQAPLECVQGPGELLYVPSGWAHATINLDECVGLAVEFELTNC